MTGAARFVAIMEDGAVLRRCLAAEALGRALRAAAGPPGGAGGPAKAPHDHPVIVPRDDVSRAQEARIALGHAIPELPDERTVRA